MNDQEYRELEEQFNKALRYRDAGDFEIARSIFSELTKDYPNTAAVFGMLGAMYRQLKMHAEAAESFKTATELSPDSELASLGLFHSLMEVGEQQSALAEMKRYLATHASEEYDLILEELESSSEREN